MKFYRNSSWRKLGFPRSKHPTREQLNGYSPSEFKTFLKRNDFRIPRNFWYSSIAIRNNRYYRFRWWNEDGFVFDESCKIPDFDRWAILQNKHCPSTNYLK